MKEKGAARSELIKANPGAKYYRFNVLFLQQKHGDLAKATANIQTGRKLNDKLKEEIMKEVVKVFDGLDIVAVQVAYEVVRVTFKSDDGFKTAMTNSVVRLFGLWCPILGGGPPVTIVHIFDYPFEEGMRRWRMFFPILVK